MHVQHFMDWNDIFKQLPLQVEHPITYPQIITDVIPIFVPASFTRTFLKTNSYLETVVNWKNICALQGVVSYDDF